MPPFEADHSGSHQDAASDFGYGLLDAFKKPIQGLQQITGTGVKDADLSVEKNESAKTTWAQQAGEMVGNAAVFYATATLLKNFQVGKFAPIAAGGVLGGLEPTHGGSSERLANVVTGAATMAVMEQMPGYLSKKGLGEHFFGCAGSVALTGATAGAMDVQLHSLFNKGQLASVTDTSTAAASWGAVAGAFHMGSLFLGEGTRLMSSSNKNLLLLGPQYSERTAHSKEFLNSLSAFGIAAKQLDVEGGCKFIGAFERGQKPVVVFPDGTTLDAEKRLAIAKKLNLHTSPDLDNYRVVVVGGGPAGVQAAINVASELPPNGQRVAVVADVFGGQAGHTSSIKNLLGFEDVSGRDLMNRGIERANKHGAEMIINRVSNIAQEDGRHVLTLADGTTMKADAVVLATGVKYNRLGAPGIERLDMKGVYALADASEAASTRGKQVFIVGGGNSAGQAAVHFANYAQRVNLIARRPLSETMSQYLVKELRANPGKINVMENAEVQEVDGGNHLETVTVKQNVGTGQEISSMRADRLYAYIGGQPNSQVARSSGIAIDEKGFILTGEQVKEKGLWQLTDRQPAPFETNVPGIFAIGDVNAAGRAKRVAAALGDAGRVTPYLHDRLSQVPALENLFAPEQPKTKSLLNLEIKIPLLTAPLLHALTDGREPAHEMNH